MLFLRLTPCLSFVLRHLELAVGTEKQVMARRGIIPSPRMRHPSLAFDAQMDRDIEQFVDEAIGLIEERRADLVGSGRAAKVRP